MRNRILIFTAIRRDIAMNIKEIRAKLGIAQESFRRSFYISAEQALQLANWSKAIDKRVAEQQKSDPKYHQYAAFTANGTLPYYGAVGGSLTYKFRRDSARWNMYVEHGYTKEVLELHDVREAKPDDAHRAFAFEVKSHDWLNWLRELGLPLEVNDNDFEFTVTPTGLGSAYTATYLPTGASKNLTDFDSW